MDENTKGLAIQYMTKMKTIVPHTDKLPIRLGTVENTTAILLGWYGTMVQGRGVEFQMDDCTLAKVEKVVKWMYESSKRGLLLCGTLGNGKTTMLRALNRFFGSHVILKEAQGIYDYYKKNQCLPSVSANDILMIDDLGVEPPSFNEFGEIRYPLVELMLARYRQNATTIIATNLTFEQIAGIYGDRIEDRMREMFAIIKYVEPSYRR